MPQHYFPATLHPADRDGLHGVVIPGVNVNASGSTEEEALADAAAILQEVLDDLAASGEPVPAPAPLSDAAEPGATVVMLPATVPGQSKRINVTMDEDLIRRIDAASANRSAFLASAARAQLAAMR